jgi:hypothetical protein
MSVVPFEAQTEWNTMNDLGLIRRAYRTLPASFRAAIYAVKLSLQRRGENKKQKLILEYLDKFSIDCFIETGTMEGHMVKAAKPHVKKVYSIELDDFRFNVCRFRFLLCRHVTVFKGDSAEVLSDLLGRVSGPALFWLDAHFSCDDAIRPEIETPIMQELSSIKNHQVKSHIILIDDVRSFGQGDYPSIETVIEFIKSINSRYHIRIEDDILRAHLD